MQRFTVKDEIHPEKKKSGRSLLLPAFPFSAEYCIIFLLCLVFTEIRKTPFLAKEAGCVSFTYSYLP